MARPRTPTALKVVKGTDQPCRINKDEPKNLKPLGAAPEYFTDEQLAVWNEFVAKAPDGVLAECDFSILECAVLQMWRIRQGDFSASDMSQMRGFLASLGMTPADRSRVSVASAKKPENKWNDV